MPYDGLITKFLGQGIAADRPVTPNLHPDAIGIYRSTDTNTTSVWANSAWFDIPSTDDMTSAIAAVSGSNTSILNGLVSGCGVVYSGSGLTWNMSAGSYYIDGDLYAATAQSITLDAADATNPRIDVLYVDTSGTLGRITGTAAANPSQPSVDPTVQLLLNFVLVPATATSLPGVTNENIYLEGSEWTPTTSGSGFTANSTNNPNNGTKDIEGTTVSAGSYVKLVRSSSMSFDGDGNLTLYIRSKATWNSRRWLTLRWYLAGVAKGTAISLKSGSFGYDSSITASYQLVVIPKSLFAVPSGTSIDELRIVDVGGSIGFYLDDIILQNNGTTTGGGTTVSGISQDQADARYLKLTGGTASGDISVPDEAYDATAWNGSLEVPTKNAVRDKIEAVVSAGGYTDEQAQDAIGAMVDSTLTYTDATPALGVNQANIKPKEHIQIACSDESTAITTGTAKVTFRMPYAFTLSEVRASVNTAPTGSTIIIDINEGGTTILSTKLSIDASEKTSTTAASAAVISDTSLADDAEMTIDFDQVGSTIAGKGVKVILVGTRT